MQRLVTGIAAAAIAVLLSFTFAQAADVRIALTQAQAGDARKYQPLLDYLSKRGVAASFVTAQDYQQAADLFSQGQVDAMFSGSGIAGTLIIKDLADPVARPVSRDNVSTYSAVVIAPKGSPKFSGEADYFANKRVIFSPLASAGEFYYHSLGPSQAKEILKAASHGAAIDALSRGQADVAIVKNHVWTKEAGKYPQLEKVGGDKGENPDSTLMVSRRMDPGLVSKISKALLGLKDDATPEAAAAKNSLEIQGYIKTTTNDFHHTINMLKSAGVTKAFSFRY
jgi:ABC-type phosphate/phosphonate transport system substrate-binding protein